MKTCTKCQKSKSPDNFRRQAGRKDGLQSACKDCQKARDRSDYLKDGRKDQITSRRTRFVQEHRTLILDYLRLHPCVDCGNDDLVVLQFDHVRGDKRTDVSKLIGRTSTRQLMEEIDKCDVRCANCHTKKTAKDFGWYKAFAGLV